MKAGNVDMSRLLLKGGAKTTYLDDDKNTLLHKAVEAQSKALVELLVDKGVSIDLRNSENISPLDLAEEKGYKDIIAYLNSRVNSLSTSTSTLSSTTSQSKLSSIKSLGAEEFVIDYRDLKLDQKIGQGGFGEVYKGTWNVLDVAIKKSLMSNMSVAKEEEFKQEAAIWFRLRHPNIAQLFGICVKPNPYCMVMDYYEKGSLYHVLKSEIELTVQHRKRIALDIASALLYLHNKKILHRDLKSLNVLIANREGKLRGFLTDFGLSKQDSMMVTKVGQGNATGTLPWMAPELLDGKKSSMPSDIYGFGILLWEIAMRKIPYNGVHSSIIPSMILRGRLPKMEEETPFNMIIKECCSKDVAKRPSAKKLISLLSAIGQPKLENPSKLENPLFAKIKELLDDAYPEEDAEDDEEVAEFRQSILAQLTTLKAKKILSIGDSDQLNRIKTDLCEELGIVEKT